MRKIGPIVICVLVAAFALAGTALGASSRPRGEVRSSVIGSVPNTTLAGVPSGGAPWTVKSGEVRLRGDGELDVHISGLVLINTGIPGLDGTVGPVRAVLASVVCGNAVVASTGDVPLDAHGDAHIRAVVSVPSPCFAPAVLVRIGATTAATKLQGPWIAATGM